MKGSLLNKIKAIVVILMVIGIGVALWFATSMIVKKSYSSRDLVIKKEVEESTTTEEVVVDSTEDSSEPSVDVEEGSIQPSYYSEEELMELINKSSTEE